MRDLPYSEACERNKAPILDVLRDELRGNESILEIGSGTGQHVVHFARNLPGTRWQPTDTGDYFTGLRARLRTESVANIQPPLELDVSMQRWPVSGCDAVFSANTLHFMAVECVVGFFAGVGRVLASDGVLVVYGPFRYGGEFTTPSNAEFDAWLRQTDPARGVRDVEWVDELAAAQGLTLKRDVAMPANNQCLVWRRITEA